MSAFFSFRGSRASANRENSSPGRLASSLSNLECDSPGAIRLHKGKRSARQHSPYGSSRRSNRLLGSSILGSSDFQSDDGRQLLSPGQKTSSSFVADKHVTIRKGAGEHGLKLQTDANLGVIVSGIDLAGQAAKNGMLVGDVIHAIEGISISTHQEALKILDTAQHSRALTITAPGSSRAVTLDKRRGDLGMTCSAVTHSSRGVLLKRIAKGSLADQAELYCGDTIISVNEQLVHTHSEAVALMNSIKTEVRWDASENTSMPLLSLRARLY